MPTFHYHALNEADQPVSGMVDASDVQQAAADLQSRGLRVQAVSVAAAPTAASSAETASPVVPRRNRPSNGAGVEQAVLYAHMATILERGRNIAPALRAYAAELPRGWQRKQLTAACDVLQRGDAAEAVATLADLPEFWIPLLGASTTSNEPGLVLSDFLSESQNTTDLRQRWWLTLAYPLILACLALTVMTALSVFIIPQFRDIFAEFDMSLPPLSMLVLNVGAFLSTWGVVLVVLCIVILVLVVLNTNRLLPTTRLWWTNDKMGWLVLVAGSCAVWSFLFLCVDWHWWWIGIVLCGALAVYVLRFPFTRRATLARFARFLADLLEAGVATPDALRIAGFTVEQWRTRQAAWQLANDVEATGTFAPQTYREALSAPIVHVLSPGTSVSTRLRLLREISSCHAERMRVGLSWTSGILEPIAIVLVGLIVGCTVLGLFLPLVKLVEGLSM
ncbi:MAG: type II secretion system F family protein [Pirellulales bacterium]